MNDGYRVVDADGKEHGPMSALDMGRMYTEGRINGDSYIYDQKNGQWRRLKEVVDLSKIESLREKLEGEPESEPAPPVQKQPVFTPTILGVTTPSSDEPRTSGMVAAAILLLINAALNILGLIFLAAEGTKATASSPAVSFFFDIIVAAGLLRGKDVWKKWAMIRALVGAVVFGLIIPITTQTIGGAIQGVYQIVFSAGIIALLYGKPPSRARVFLGSAAVILAWFGAVGGAVVEVMIDQYKTKNEIAKQALPTRQFVDDALGVKMDLPEGWNLLSSDNTIVPAPDAPMIAINSNSGCFALLIVEFLPDDTDGAGSLDNYLNMLLESRRARVPTMKLLGLSDAQFANLNARRQVTEWVDESQKVKGFNSVCRSGENYYLLSGWCIDESYREALQDFIALEKSLHITEPPDK